MIERRWRTASTMLPVPASPLERIIAAPSEIAPQRLAEVGGPAHERHVEGELVDVVGLVGRREDLALVDEVDAERLQDLGLDEVTDAGLGHHRDRHRGLDALDHLRVAHPGHATVAADVGRHPLERHHGAGAGVLGDPGVLGGDDVHDDAALEHLGQAPLDRERAGGTRRWSAHGDHANDRLASASGCSGHLPRVRTRPVLPSRRQLDERPSGRQLDRHAVLVEQGERLEPVGAQPRARDHVAAGEHVRLAAADALGVGAAGDARQVLHLQHDDVGRRDLLAGGGVGVHRAVHLPAVHAGLGVPRPAGARRRRAARRRPRRRRPAAPRRRCGRRTAAAAVPPAPGWPVPRTSSVGRTGCAASGGRAAGTCPSAPGVELDEVARADGVGHGGVAAAPDEQRAGGTSRTGRRPGCGRSGSARPGRCPGCGTPWRSGSGCR